MPPPVEIAVRLAPADINVAAREIAHDLTAAMQGEVAAFRDAGRRMGDALNAGLREAVERARVIRQQYESLFAGLGSGLGSGGGGGAGPDPAARLKPLRDETLALAQANARLKVAQGDAAGASRDLGRALEGQEQQTLQVVRAQTQLAQIDNKITREGASGWRRYASTIREAGESIQQTGYALTGTLTAGLLAVGRAAVQSAVEIDRNVNVLKALTGSAAAAETRFAALAALSAKTPGLTSGLATTLDAQLRVANVSVQTIDKILPALGRLNAVAPLGDPQKFASNLVQLITQGFERADLKELVGQSPLAGELIKSIFNVDSPTNAKAIRDSAKKLGIDTTEAFFTAFADAAQKNQKLASITESIGTQFEKLKDRVAVALRPLGLTIIQTLQPLVERVVPVIERLSQSFANLPEPVRQAILVVAGLVAALGPLLIVLGGVIQAVGAVGNLVTVFSGLTAEGGLLAGVATAIGAAFSEFLPVIIAVGAALAVLAAAWATDFAGIRTITNEAFGLIIDGFHAIVGVFRDMGPEFDKLKTEFGRLSQEVAPIVRALWDVIKVGAGVAFDVALGALRVWIQTMVTGLQFVLGVVRSVVNEAKTLIAGLAGTLANFAAPGTGGAVFNAVRGVLNSKPRENSQGDFEVVTQQDIGAAFQRQKEADAAAAAAAAARRNAKTKADGDAEAKERALRQANLAFDKSQAENALKLFKDANDRELRVLEETYQQSAVTVREYYGEKLRLALSTIDAEIAANRQQQQEIRDALPQTKGAETVRLQEKLNDLLTQENLLRGQTFDAIAKNNAEARKAFEIKPNDLSKQPVEVVVDEEALRLQKQYNDLKSQAGQYQVADNQLRTRELEIQNAVNAGVLTARQGKEATLAVQREYRDALIAALQAQEKLTTDPARIEQLRAQMEGLRNLGLELSPAQAFLKGLRSEAETTAEAFERIGTNFKDKTLSALDAGIDRLTQKFGFFKDLIGDILKSLTRRVISNLFGLGGSGGGQAPSSGGGFSIGSFLGGLFGGGQQGGGGGFGGFATPSFNPNGGGGSLAAVFQALTGGASAGNLPSAGLATITAAQAGIPTTLDYTTQLARAAGAKPGGFLSLLGGSLGSLFQGFGFGKTPGSGLGSLAQAAPLLGLSLGANAGGSSILGQLLGGAGGLAIGVGLTAAPTALAGTFLAPLFSNPITAIVGGALLVGAIFLGKAAQRKKDEEASGQMLQQAVDAIAAMRQQAEAGTITDVAQARAYFEQNVIGQFIAGINTLKTASVRESRLTNQVRDLRNLFESSVVPKITAAVQKQATALKLVPEFHTGGLSENEQLAVLLKDEMVLTRRHQIAVQQIVGFDVFAAVGVPNAGRMGPYGLPQYHDSGRVAPVPGASAAYYGGTETVEVAVSERVDADGIRRIVFQALRSPTGKNYMLKAYYEGRRDNEI